VTRPAIIFPFAAVKGGTIVTRTFTVSITREGDWYIAQCLDVDVASQGTSKDDALMNLHEALELHFSPPVATDLPDLQQIEVEIGAA
jgi:predicted RNase H-like HicB family nuclease